MTELNQEYIDKVTEIMDKYLHDNCHDCIHKTAKEIVEYMDEEVFQAICDARGD